MQRPCNVFVYDTDVACNVPTLYFPQLKSDIIVGFFVEYYFYVAFYLPGKIVQIFLSICNVQ